MTDKELNLRIVENLLIIPDELREAEIILGNAKLKENELKAQLSDAEFDAEINAIIDGKNAEERKRQLKQAISESSVVQLVANELMAQEAEIITIEANVKAISRNFRANLALAELQAARLNLMAKYPKQNK